MSKLAEQIDKRTYCGGLCETCPRYFLSLEEDPAKLLPIQTVIAAYEKTMWGIEADPAEFGSCQGCKSGGKLTSYCEICEIRQCAMEKGMTTCAHCPEYPDCAHVQLFLSRHTPHEEVNLALIRACL